MFGLYLSMYLWACSLQENQATVVPGVFFFNLSAMRYVNVGSCGNRSLSVDLVGSGSLGFLVRGIDSLFRCCYVV